MLINTSTFFISNNKDIVIIRMQIETVQDEREKLIKACKIYENFNSFTDKFIIYILANILKIILFIKFINILQIFFQIH